MSCNRKGKIERNSQDIERQFLKNGASDSVKETWTSKTILDPRDAFFKRWSVVFLLSCIIAVALDPLFFYLPVINEDKKCIRLDKKLWITAIVLRSFFDIIYLLHIILQFRTGFIDKKLLEVGRPELNTNAWKIARKYLWPRFLWDVLTILPIPQVVILIIFSEMRSTKSSNTVQLLNSFLLFQYVPRVSQIYQSRQRLIRNYGKFERIILVKVSLNFMLYILAGHALGAFWYFLSTQRLAACWHIACENHSECVGSSFNCDHNFKNISFIDDICPINIANTTSFNFGIFLEALQSGVLLESTDFPGKLLYGFWWGMRNLSSLGQSLETSNYIWENCFAFSISVFGLILFLYFMMGNLQIYMQWRTTKEEEKGRKPRIRKWRKRQYSLKLWMSKHGFDRTTRDKIIDYIDKSYEADEDVYVETLIPDLPTELRRAVNRHICLKLLKKVDLLRGMEEQMLHTMCHSLKPMFHSEHSYIIREGDPIDAIFFITDGTLWTYTNTASNNNGEGTVLTQVELLVEGEYFGEELLEWFQKSTASRNNLSKLPVSSRTLKAHTKVEVFALMAQDLKQILHSKLSSLGPEQLPSAAASVVQRIWRHKHPKTEDSVVIKSKKAASILLPPVYR